MSRGDEGVELDELELGLRASVSQTRRFQSGRYMVIRLEVPSREQAQVLFEDLAEAASNLRGRPTSAEAASHRTEASIYQGFRRIVIGRLAIEIVVKS